MAVQEKDNSASSPFWAAALISALVVGSSVYAWQKVVANMEEQVSE